MLGNHLVKATMPQVQRLMALMQQMLGLKALMLLALTLRATTTRQLAHKVTARRTQRLVATVEQTLLGLLIPQSGQDHLLG